MASLFEFDVVVAMNVLYLTANRAIPFSVNSGSKLSLPSLEQLQLPETHPFQKVGFDSVILECVSRSGRVRSGSEVRLSSGRL